MTGKGIMTATVLVTQHSHLWQWTCIVWSNLVLQSQHWTDHSNFWHSQADQFKSTFLGLKVLSSCSPQYQKPCCPLGDFEWFNHKRWSLWTTKKLVDAFENRVDPAGMAMKTLPTWWSSTGFVFFPSKIVQVSHLSSRLDLLGESSVVKYFHIGG
jgi:hypothetical protein